MISIPRIRIMLFIALSLLTVATVAAAANPSSAPSNEIQLKKHNITAYLGIGVDLIPKELVAQLPEDVLIGQGIMVTRFADDSPAPKQGLKAYDVILGYDGKAIMHPQAFINFIKNDKPGRSIKLKVVRQGKILTIPLTLGTQQYPLTDEQLDYNYNMQVNGYDGLKVKMYSVDDFEAAIRYLASDGVVRSRTFKGNYNKVQREVFGATDMAQTAKLHIMNAINKRKKDEEGWFGKWIPFNDGNFSPDSIKNFGL